MFGIDINSNKIKQLLESILNKYNVKLEGNTIVIKTRVENVLPKTLNLIQAMLHIDNVFMVYWNQVAWILLEDVYIVF